MGHRLPPLSAPWVSARPRLLLVDDHRGVLDRVSALLADDFDVAGVATNGRQALDAAREIAPDAIVLDVNMPELDGFQTMRALQQTGSRAPVVFLSMVDSEEHVAEAFRCGGRGYVLKSRIARDLGNAIGHALRGRLFAPSLTSLWQLAPDGGHAMQVHGDTSSFLDGVAACFDRALRRGDATCVIATEEIRTGLAARLQTRGWDEGHKRIRVIDAADALNRFIRDGLPNPERLSEIATELNDYRAEAGEGQDPRLTVFGNMVVLLAAQGNSAGVLAVENLWSALTHGLPFITLCGYAASCFHGDVHDLYAGACAAHQAVGHTADVESY